MLTVHTLNRGFCAVFFVFNTSLANPGLYLTLRNVKMCSNIIFVNIVVTNIVFNLMEKLGFCAGRTGLTEIIIRERSMAYITLFGVVK